jgi:hypothetical protein
MSVVRCQLSVANLTLIDPKLDQVSVVSCQWFYRFFGPLFVFHL